MSFVVQRWYSGGYCPHFEWKSLSFCKPRVSSSLFLGLSLCSLKFDAHKMYSNWMHRLCRDAQTYLYIYRDTKIYLYIYIHMYILCTPSVCVYLYIYMYTETFEAGKEILAVDTHLGSNTFLILVCTNISTVSRPSRNGIEGYVKRDLVPVVLYDWVCFYSLHKK